MLARQKKGAGGRVDAALERSAASAGALLGPPAVPRMVGCVGCFWVLLSSCLVAVCSFSFLSPAWIVKERGARRLTGLPEDGGGGEVSFGLLWHCAEPWRHVRDCYTVGGLGRFSEIPSGSWQLHNILRGRADVWPRRVAHSLVIEYEDPPNDQNAVQGDRECSCPSEILDSQGDLDSSMAGAMPMDLEGPVDIVEGADSEETMLEMINEPGTPVRNEDAVVVEEHDSPERDPDGIAPGSAVSELTPKSRLALIRARKKRVSAMQKIGEQMMAQATQEYTGMMEAVRQEHVEFVNEMRETRMEERESREALLQILQSTAKSLSDISSALLRSGGRVGWRSNNLRSRATVSRRQPLLPPSSDEQTTWPVLCTETQEEGLGQEGVTLTLVVPETATELVAEAASVSLDSANPGGSPIQNRPRRALKRKLRYSPQH